MTASYLSRIGSSNAYEKTLQNISNRQSTLAELQENLTSGKKVLRSSDDPTGAALAERALTRINRVAADQRALEAQRNSIASAESTLGEVVDRLQEFRELVVQAGNGSYTAAERSIVGKQLNSLREHIINLANRNDSNGMPLFGGLGSEVSPFKGPGELPMDYTFKGLPGQTASTVNSIPYSLDGDSAFMFQPARDGIYNVTVKDLSGTGAITAPRTLSTDTVSMTNASKVNDSRFEIEILSVLPGATPGTNTLSYSITETTSAGVNLTPTGPFVVPDYPADKPVNFKVDILPQPFPEKPALTLNIKGTPAAGDTINLMPRPSIFSALDDAIRNIGSAPNNNGSSQAVVQALSAIDAGMNRVMAVRGQAGELLNRADRITDSNSKLNSELEANRSRAEDLDMVKGISDFQNQQTGYQAALQSYAQVQKLSLFDYIR
jgi:flagellar hook-associated protein 3 FlgL